METQQAKKWSLKGLLIKLVPIVIANSVLLSHQVDLFVPLVGGFVFCILFLWMNDGPVVLAKGSPFVAKEPTKINGFFASLGMICFGQSFLLLYVFNETSRQHLWILILGAALLLLSLPCFVLFCAEKRLSHKWMNLVFQS